MAKLDVINEDFGTIYAFHCPACGYGHPFHVREDGKRPSWQFNGDMQRPTFTPSLRVNGYGQYPDCHLNLTDGKLQYHADSTHALAGQTIDLPEND